MIGRRLAVLALAVALCAAGTLAGFAAGPALARWHYVVQVAESVQLEEEAGTPGESLQGEAFRTVGAPRELLFADAEDIRRKFALGGALLGLWCGLVIGLKAISIEARLRGREYRTDQALCVSCARCFLSCPVERERRGEAP